MDIGDRMKKYEVVSTSRIVPRCPAILRIDGRAFHTFTKGFDKPYDSNLHFCMHETAIKLCKEISTARIAYGQSDEISLLLNDYINIDTQQWLDGKVQKMVSVASSIACVAFNEALYNVSQRYHSDSTIKSKLFKAQFDARVFSIPKEDVVNYFIWRQQDAIRNSVQMLGRTNFSHKKLIGKSCEDIKSMLQSEVGINWEDLDVVQKHGYAVYKTKQLRPSPVDEGKMIKRNIWSVDNKIPSFVKDRYFVEQWS